MRRSRWAAALCRVGLVACLAIALGRDAAAQTIDTIDIRGHAQSLHLYGTRGAPPVIVSSGDGGWIHLGPHVADVLAARGFFVVGFDAKAYLESFTSGKSTLRPEDEPGDYKVLADYAARGATERPILIGVSEGAGLSVLAATDPRTKTAIAGVIALGLPNLNELGWRWKDALIYLTHGVPNEPTFSTAAMVDRVSPAPVAAIHSTRDEFVPLAEVQRVIDAAREPKRLWIVEAVRPPLQRQPDGVRSASARGDRLGPQSRRAVRRLGVRRLRQALPVVDRPRAVHRGARGAAGRAPRRLVACPDGGRPRARRCQRFALAIVLTGLNYAALTGYDLLAFAYIGKRLPRAPDRRWRRSWPTRSPTTSGSSCCPARPCAIASTRAGASRPRSCRGSSSRIR